MKVNTKNMGSIFILTSTVLFIYIYLPILKLEFEYYKSSKSNTISIPVSADFGIVIDKLGINEPVTANVNPFDQSEYLPILSHSIAHAASSSTPDENGSTYLFAHSSDNPFSITRYNTSFYLLDKLQPGDKIKLYHHQQLYEYVVAQIKVVKPSQVSLLTSSDKNQLILQTCTPIGTSINRLIVIAQKVTLTNPI